MPTEGEMSRLGRGPWFGRQSFTWAAVGGFVNVVVPITLHLFFLFFVFLGPFLYAVELLVVVVLWAIGGRARQAGTGIAISIAGALATLVTVGVLVSTVGR
ncbi:hypothetical protein [Nocardia sp. NPDC127526]|uniref:hypothetical protein n=1 Tax=Nocardia sp. NPDC127526 TaxID=3345393 RepID=UPI003642C7D3